MTTTDVIDFTPATIGDYVEFVKGCIARDMLDAAVIMLDMLGRSTVAGEAFTVAVTVTGAV